MTPAIAAEGRRLLEALKRNRGADDVTRINGWLWKHREELVRLAESQQLDALEQQQGQRGNQSQSDDEPPVRREP